VKTLTVGYWACRSPVVKNELQFEQGLKVVKVEMSKGRLNKGGQSKRCVR